MSEYWYYAEGNETRGPIAFEQLIKLLSELPTLRGVLVWREGFADWTPAANVREIVEKLIRPPPLGPRSSAAVTESSAETRSDDTVERYQQQFRSTETISTERTSPKKWSLWRAALYGFLLGVFTFVLSNTANDSWKHEMAWWQFGRPGQIIGYFGGRFLFTPFLFVVIAIIRNLLVKNKVSQ
jgi:hypothetical protein